jgi:hypothetical protein
VKVKQRAADLKPMAKGEKERERSQMTTRKMMNRTSTKQPTTNLLPTLMLWLIHTMPPILVSKNYFKVFLSFPYTRVLSILTRGSGQMMMTPVHAAHLPTAIDMNGMNGYHVSMSGYGGYGMGGYPVGLNGGGGANGMISGHYYNSLYWSTIGGGGMHHVSLPSVHSVSFHVLACFVFNYIF